MRRLLPLILVSVAWGDGAAQRIEQAVAYGASYPDGAKGVGLLVDMLDDDDASVREAAAKSLAALGRKGVADLSRYLKDPKEPSRPAFKSFGGALARLGSVVERSDLADVMAGGYGPHDQRVAVASTGLAVCWDRLGRDPMIDLLTVVRRDADLSATASASLAILGWTAVADKHPASAADVKDLATMVVAPPDAPWVSCVAAATIALLCPRGDWPRHVADYPFAGPHKDPAAEPDRLGEFRAALLAASARSDSKRSEALREALLSIRRLGAAAADAKPDLLQLLATKRGVDHRRGSAHAPGCRSRRSGRRGGCAWQ